MPSIKPLKTPAAFSVKQNLKEMQIGFLEFLKYTRQMVTVLTFLGKDMMTNAVTWVKKKKRWAQISQKCPQLSPK